MCDFDVERFRAFEHDGWQKVSRRYHDAFGQLTKQSIPQLLEAVDLTAGMSLLDVCTGPGYAAAAAAGRGAIVTGVDFSSNMVAEAREHCPTVEFLEADAERLPFADDSFDAVVMNFGLLHLPSPERAIAEAFRVLSPRARFAATVWADSDDALGFGVFVRAIQTHGRADVDLPSGPDFYRFSDPAECRRIFVTAGFDSPTIREIVPVWRAATADQMLDSLLQDSVRTGALLRAQTDDALSQIRSAIRESTRRFQTPSGMEMPMPAVLAWSTKGR